MPSHFDIFAADQLIVRLVASNRDEAVDSAAKMFPWLTSELRAVYGGSFSMRAPSSLEIALAPLADALKSQTEQAR